VEAKLGRKVHCSIPAEELPRRIEAMLRGFLAHRALRETFQNFTNRHNIEELKRLFEAGAVTEA
jgi:ferredoxin-nitrite reductase